jgi:3'-phosphoadenosine 5'-phosphosulfate sulfotransferase (PAPS reductase)/FAD synthetase
VAIHTISELKQFQAMPLQVKILMSKTRIRAWINEFGEDGVYISFSGGKDSTVLLDLVREDYPNVKAMFVDTGLEYPEIRQFVRTFDNVDIVKPKMNFKQVIEKYGYPFISKEISKNVYYAKRSIERGDFGGVHLKKLNGTLIDKDGNKSKFCTEKYKFLLESPFPISSNCCDVMKKSPAHAYEKATGRVKITGQMAEESMLRTTKWLQNGCNGFDMKRPTSNPLSFWTEQDILRYIKEKDLKICSVYGDVVVDYGSEELSGQMDLSDLGLMTDTRKLKTTGCSRTGCMFCGYGCHLEKEGEGRFERMKETHPKIYDYIMRPKDQGGLNYKEVIDWINNNSDLNIRY